MPSAAYPSSDVSDITYVEAGNGVLLYRGQPIAELAEGHRFTQVAYLLLYGELPLAHELQSFERRLASACEPIPAMQKWLSCLAPDTEPLAVLASALMLFPSHTPGRSPEEDAVQILAQGRNFVAWWLGHMRGRAGVELPGLEIAWASGLLTRLSSMPDSLPLSRADEALNQVLILQTDYEPNCSISTARLVAGSGAGLRACVAAATGAFSGFREGGESAAVMRTLEQLHLRQGNAEQLLEEVRAGDSELPGFGQDPFSQQDPRARLLKRTAYEVMAELHEQDPIFGLAAELEHVVLEAPYFQARRLYANIHFYSALIYRALGVPTPMFAAMGVLARLPAWSAHALEALRLSDKQPPRKLP